MTKATELKRKIKELQDKQNKLMKQEYILQDELTELERSKWLDKIRKNIHIGDIRLLNNGLTNYHCDLMNVYEILDVSEHTNKCKRNGIPFTYTSCSIKVREFTIQAYDGDRYSRIETKTCFDNTEALLRAKKISKTDFEDFKATVFLDPDSYDGSKWDVNKKEAK